MTLVEVKPAIFYGSIALFFESLVSTHVHHTERTSKNLKPCLYPPLHAEMPFRRLLQMPGTTAEVLMSLSTGGVC